MGLFQPDLCASNHPQRYLDLPHRQDEFSRCLFPYHDCDPVLLRHHHMATASRSGDQTVSKQPPLFHQPRQDELLLKRRQRRRPTHTASKDINQRVSDSTFFLLLHVLAHGLHILCASSLVRRIDITRAMFITCDLCFVHRRSPIPDPPIFLLYLLFTLLTTTITTFPLSVLNRLKQDGSEINRILWLLGGATLGMILSLLFQLAKAKDALDTRYVRDPWKGPVPSTTNDVLFEGVFDALHMVAMCMALFFFRVRRSSPSEEKEEKMREAKEQALEVQSQRLSRSNSRRHSRRQRRSTLRASGSGGFYASNPSSNSSDLSANKYGSMMSMGSVDAVIDVPELEEGEGEATQMDAAPLTVEIESSSRDMHSVDLENDSEGEDGGSPCGVELDVVVEA